MTTIITINAGLKEMEKFFFDKDYVHLDAGPDMAFEAVQIIAGLQISFENSEEIIFSDYFFTSDKTVVIILYNYIFNLSKSFKFRRDCKCQKLLQVLQKQALQVKVH